jgi:hypothetical protein
MAASVQLITIQKTSSRRDVWRWLFDRISAEFKDDSPPPIVGQQFDNGTIAIKDESATKRLISTKPSATSIYAEQ